MEELLRMGQKEVEFEKPEVLKTDIPEDQLLISETSEINDSETFSHENCNDSCNTE